jgi:hypothetical protein
MDRETYRALARKLNRYNDSGGTHELSPLRLPYHRHGGTQRRHRGVGSVRMSALFHLWRSAEPADRSTRERYPVEFRLTQADIDKAIVEPEIQAPVR